MTITVDTHQALLQTLKGQMLKVPDLVALIYAGWEVENHENEADIRDEMEHDFLVKWCPDPKKRAKLRKGNFAQQASYFWTGCSLERLRPLAQFMYWYFIWDDEVDCGELTHDREGTKSYIQDTIEFMKWCLEPDNYFPVRAACPISATNHNSGCFEAIGQAMQIGHSKEALQRYADSMYEFVKSVGEVQKQRDTGFPTWKEYIDNRVYSIGAYPCLMAMEYAYGLSIPSWVYDHEAMRRMFRETAISCIIVNDIISFKKEVVDGQLDSTIPLKMHWHGKLSAQAALDDAIRDLQESRLLFDSAEHLLLTSTCYTDLEETTQNDIRVLVQGCKNMMVGNVKWSLSNHRYLPNEELEGWKVSFAL